LRRLAWSLTIVLILLSSLMFIPTVRAAVIEFFQVGIVRIFPQPIEPTTESTQPAITTSESIVPVTDTPGESLIPLLEKISGRTSLANAQKTISYPILLPTYPPELGEPDRIYVQDANGDMTILVWMDPQQPTQVAMSLHFIPNGSWAIAKMGPEIIQETRVNGGDAVWAVGPYPLRVYGPEEIDFTRLVDGNVLIWADENLTYRLETDLPLEEAIKIAESLEPPP
jgi:hypothetical protein